MLNILQHSPSPLPPVSPPTLAPCSPLAIPSTGAYKHAGRRDSYRPDIDNDDIDDPSADFAGIVCVTDKQEIQHDPATGSRAAGTCRQGERARGSCYSRAGAELWRTDGTAKGTRRVDDLRTGVSGSSPSYMTVFDGALFYAAHTDLTGTELFRSDGTAGGAYIVEVRHPMYPSDIFVPRRYQDSRKAFGQTYLFSVGSPLCVTVRDAR